MSDEIDPLKPGEIRRLTGRRSRVGQVLELAAMGIPCIVRSDKSIYVDRADVARKSGAAKPATMTIPDPEPDWSALDAETAEA